MKAIEALRARLPEPARDTRLNLQSVLRGESLATEQVWGVAVAAAIATRNRDVRDAVLADARAAASAEVIDDAVAAASLMAMNNVYYRFRHMLGKAAYEHKPARLRMNRMVRPATSKVDFELFCLAVSAINGCEACLAAHEKTVIEHGLTEDQVHDAARIAAVIQATAVSLEAGLCLDAAEALVA